MGSILSNPLPTQQTSQNPTIAVNNIIQKILGSMNPQEMFNQVLNNSPEAKNAMELINKFGNGDPKTAFMNYMTAEGKQSLGQQIMKNFNLH